MILTKRESNLPDGRLAKVDPEPPISHEENVVGDSALIGLYGASDEMMGVNGYRDFLVALGLTPKAVEFHWQIGEISGTEGWLLHISIVRSQIVDALKIVIPWLVEENVAFRLIKDHLSAILILDGDLGVENLGKVLTIYPNSSAQALELAKGLICLTARFKGPSIPTDIRLGGIVYVRYGGFNPIVRSDAGGNLRKYINGPNGKLVEDMKPIPFMLPSWVSWPFAEIACDRQVKRGKFLHGIYRSLGHLKTSPRGDVIKAHYISKFFAVKTCVIKQGKRNMWSDDYGRDMIDRLLWQQKFYSDLAGKIRMPKILDFFEENEDAFLCMEFVKGKSLFDYFSEHLYRNSNCFLYWPVGAKIEAIDYMIKVADVVKDLHGAGYVHRDVTPVNFMIEKGKELVLIDNELAASVKDLEPDPPFAYGTHGFISPEQMLGERATFKEDIYGLGATLVTVFTGLTPVCFAVTQLSTLEERLIHYVDDPEMSAKVTQCLALEPDIRPDIADVGHALRRFRERLPQEKPRYWGDRTRPDLAAIKGAIQGSIQGLVSEPMVMHGDLWLSRWKNSNTPEEKPSQGFAKLGGFYEGVSGVMYCLGKAVQAGFDVSICSEAYQRSYSLLQERYLVELPHIPPGMAGGAAGMAMAIAKGMSAGLLEDDEENRGTLKMCLGISHVDLGLADGVAGQGMAAIECARYLDPDDLEILLKGYCDIILTAQDKNGNWGMVRTGRKRPETAILFHQGNTGINLFLLRSFKFLTASESVEPNSRLWSGILKALQTFQRMHVSVKNRFLKIGFRGSLLDPQLRDGFKGIILNYLSAFEITRDRAYLELAEDLLACYPSHLVHEDFSMQYGVAGIGHLFLEAFRVSGKNCWEERANWIAQFFLDTSYHDPIGNRYWLTNNQTEPVADYMVGNSGILDFLIAFYEQHKQGKTNGDFY